MLEHTDYTDALRKEVVETVSRIPIEYNPQGWEKLSKQLDAELPVSKGGKTGFNMNGKWIRFSVLLTVAILVLSVTQGSEPVSSSVSTMEQKDVEQVNEVQEVVEDLTHSTTSNSSQSTNRAETMSSSERANEQLNSSPQGDISSFDPSETEHRKMMPATHLDTSAYIPKTEQKEDSVFIFW